jgi:hypothetical protein
LGSIIQVSRDKDPKTGKTKFGNDDEAILSHWMKDNLIMFFLANKDHANLERILITQFNPPLNLGGNNNQVNLEFRQLLSSLRSQKEG